MLVVRIYVNLDEIDVVCIQRIGPAAERNSYKVMLSDGTEVPGRVNHRRSDGAISLVATVFTLLAEAGYGRREGML